MKEECAYLCFAFGESDFPAAVIATTREAVLKFLVDEWFGERPEKMCAANHEQWAAVVEEFDSHDWQEEGPIKWKFEIGGVTITRVALPAEADAPGEKDAFIAAFKFWYERDGSVGGLSQVVEEHAHALRNLGPEQKKEQP